jgi:hypothetical protein
VRFRKRDRFWIYVDAEQFGGRHSLCEQSQVWPGVTAELEDPPDAVTVQLAHQGDPVRRSIIVEVFAK